MKGNQRKMKKIFKIIIIMNNKKILNNFMKSKKAFKNHNQGHLLLTLIIIITIIINLLILCFKIKLIIFLHLFKIIISNSKKYKCQLNNQVNYRIIGQKISINWKILIFIFQVIMLIKL